uniref:Fibrinogen C-terminal domain-containing protein n=1 Tax=Macrostomum lignano TaxID=282301 RepID=A0A1I8J905_9PLAT
AGIGDSLARSNDFQFTTKDADHDVHSDNCGSRYFGAWWFADCHNTHPNGQYRDFSSAIDGPRAQGIIWKSPFGPYYSLKEIEMLTISSDCWTTVQHRVSGSVDFYRGWTQYQSEFGEGPDGNYWIGLNTLHDLTASGPRKLRILMKAWNDSEHWAEYSSFSVGPESDNYRLSVSGFSGSAGIGDSLARSNDFQFTTKDADHDVHSDNCGSRYFGAWWFADCHNTHPNGQYRDFSSAIGGPRAQGVIWKSPFALNPRVARVVSAERTWRLSRDGLAEYEAASSFWARSDISCMATADSDPAVQLVAFNASSGLCAHFRCRLGLRHCRKGRNVNKGDHQVWTAGSDCWTTVQHRVSGSVDFYRNWTQYQSEFGEGPDGNYWIAHFIWSSKLVILMTAWNDSEHWAEYSSFSVGPESDNYRLSVSGFSGSAGIGDSLARSNDFQFTTKDADNDVQATYNCAERFVSAWWFSNCFDTNPNGEYKDSASAIGGAPNLGILWKYPFDREYSLKKFEMLIF